MKNLFLILPLIFTTLTLAQDRQPRMPQTRLEAQELMDDAAKDFAQVQLSYKRTLEYTNALMELNKNFVVKSQAQAKKISAMVLGGSSADELLSATKNMQETQMSFNLQYLQLQSQMQHENRSYTAISNIMKTKHDTVKNSISNIR